MVKHLRAVLLFCCFFMCSTMASAFVDSTGFYKILNERDRNIKEHKMVRYLLTYYEAQPVDSLPVAQTKMGALLIQYHEKNAGAYIDFIEYLYRQRLKQMNVAEKALVRAIALANKESNHYLLYAFCTELAFLQTYTGNTIDAVNNFRRAKQQAILLNNTEQQIVVDINISDIYYKNNFYSQSIFYLEQALSLFNESNQQQRLKNIIYNNFAESYFRIGDIRSLKKYNQLLHAIPDGGYKKDIFTRRSDYYVRLLSHDYKGAIQSILKLKTDPLYRYENADEQNLADAYYNSGEDAEAKNIFKKLLADSTENNHPEIKFHLYEMLGKIAGKENNQQDAAYNFKMALQQAEEQITRLTQVDNISAQIKIDDIQGVYLQKELWYKKERLGLILVTVIALLTIVLIAMVFNNTKQKRYYEKLLFTTQKEELAFINSHEVRRHLSNIMGLTNLIKYSSNKNEEYMQAEEYLLLEIENLDNAIKNISDKLDN